MRETDDHETIVLDDCSEMENVAPTTCAGGSSAGGRGGGSEPSVKN